MLIFFLKEEATNRLRKKSQILNSVTRNNRTIFNSEKAKQAIEEIASWLHVSHPFNSIEDTPLRLIANYEQKNSNEICKSSRQQMKLISFCFISKKEITTDQKNDKDNRTQNQIQLENNSINNNSIENNNKKNSKENDDIEIFDEV
eukprot:TRINITY_DN611_c2_g1_i1.p1 TRINITY_DN611_c2_g1~~TRINITY_DN611_c2_g1_i1.p1  ORF type:complete len:146 (+),score=42.12 TRINITY_DN611_c2_g1_i1:336-773(+)